MKIKSTAALIRNEIVRLKQGLDALEDQIRELEYEGSPDDLYPKTDNWSHVRGW